MPLPPRKRQLIAGFIAALLAGDLAVAYLVSPAIAQNIRQVLERRMAADISFRDLRVHPLFLSFSMNDVRVSEADSSVQVLRGKKLRGRLAMRGLLARKMIVTDLTIDRFDMKVIKDDNGTLNVEKILRSKEPADPEQAPPGEHFVGWKHKDWVFNLYERLKFEVRGDKKSSPSSPEKFGIAKVTLRNGSLILTDRRMKPLRFQRIRMDVRGLRWYENGSFRLDSLAVGGELRSETEGKFHVAMRRRKGRIDFVVRLREVDLALLTPLYKSSSPVFFERGYGWLDSRSRVQSERILSENRLGITGYKMRSVVDWSPESQIFLGALNGHPELMVEFAVRGHPDEPAIAGLEDSFMQVIEKDFDAKTLATIRKRLAREVTKIEARFRTRG